MNMLTIPARTAKFIGVGILAASLLAMTGCASSETAPKAPVDNGTPAATASPTQQPESLRGKLVRVIDGDHVVLTPVSDKNGQPTGEPDVTVNILGIKAPALDACGGTAAADEIKTIIGGADFFRVTYDAQSARTDVKGFAQGYLTSGDGTGTPIDVGNVMVHNGYAAAWYDPSDHAPTSYAVDSKNTKIAQHQKYGMWEKCPAIDG